jgi:hypothetical protein
MPNEHEQMVAFLKTTLDRERSTRAKLGTYVGRSMKVEAFARYRARSEENERELIAALAALGIHDA